MQAAGDASALEGLRGAVLLAEVHKSGHLVLKDKKEFDQHRAGGLRRAQSSAAPFATQF